MNRFHYTFLARDNRGTVHGNSDFRIKIAIRENAPDGNVVYSEIHDVHSEADGLTAVEVGAGAETTGQLSDIRCGYGRYYLELQQDLSGGSTFETVSVTEIPSAYSAAAESAGNGVCNSFVISPDGKTGIGTLTPQYSLDVVGDLGLDGEIHIKDVVIKVTQATNNGLNQGNLFFGWNNGSLTGSLAKFENIIIGKEAGRNAENMTQNILVGTGAGKNLTNMSSNNILMGFNAGSTNPSARVTNNICMGEQAGQNMRGTLESNIVLGEKAGYDMNGGISNVIIGKYAGNTNQSDFNIFIGHNCGAHNTTGDSNTFIGSMDTGVYNTTGRWNTFVGGSSGEDNVSGNFNTYVGHSSGSDSKGSGNTFIGHEAGIFCKNGDENVFIGRFAGKNENGSHRLYIANSETSDPLIYGEFDNQKAAVNGDLGIRNKNPQRALHVNDVMRLEPRNSAPSSPSEGDIYMDGTDHKLKVYDGSSWKACW